MKVSPAAILRICLAAVVVLAAILLVRMHNAGGAPASSDSAAAGYRLAQAWCRECHAIEAPIVGTRGSPPDFIAIANRPSTTALSLKVFFQTSHRNMPNLIIAPDQADDLVNYILSLKRN